MEGAISSASDYDSTNVASRVVEEKDQSQGEQPARLQINDRCGNGILQFVVTSALFCLMQVTFLYAIRLAMLTISASLDIF